MQNNTFSFFFCNFAFGLKSQTAVVEKERVLITYDNRLGSLRRAECNKVINMTYLHKAGIGWEKQSRHIRRLQTSRSTYTLKREKFQDTCTALNMTTVNVQRCDIPFVFLLKHLLCSDILSYKLFASCRKCGYCYISYRRGLYCCSFSSIGTSHGLRVWIGQRTVHASFCLYQRNSV